MLIDSHEKSSVSKISGIGLEERPRAAAAVPGRDEAPVRLRPAALLGDRRGWRAARVLLEPSLSVPQHFDPHRLGERVYDAHADAVEAAGDLVAAAAELPAGVEDGHDDLQGALPGGVLVDRDAAAVVDDLQLPVGVDGDVNAGGDVRHRLVDAVVDHLPDELVEATRIGRADVHAGPLADRLQALEDLDAGGRVFGPLRAAGSPRWLSGHGWWPSP